MEGCGSEECDVFPSDFLASSSLQAFPVPFSSLPSVFKFPHARTTSKASDQLNLRRICFCCFPIFSCPFLLLPGLELSSIWSLFQTLSSIHVCSIFGEGNGTPLQYSCLENPTDGGAWWAAVYGVVKSQTRLSDFTFTFHFHALEKEMATHSSVLAWRIPGTAEPGGLPSMGSHRVGHD